MTVAIIPLPDIPLVEPGMSLATLVGDAIVAARVGLKDGDVVAVCQKIVSKAEGALAPLADVQPSAFATTLAAQGDEPRDPRVLEVVLRESARIVRNDRGHLIVQTRHGFVCANAGVDQSNGVTDEVLTLLPRDPDASADRIRAAVRDRLGVDVPVVVSDSFGRPWRWGIVDVAIGVSGLHPLEDLRGAADADGRPMRVTVRAVADELASAAELALGKVGRRPVALVRGADPPLGDGSIREALMESAADLFR